MSAGFWCYGRLLTLLCCGHIAFLTKELVFGIAKEEPSARHDQETVNSELTKEALGAYPRLHRLVHGVVVENCAFHFG